MHTETESYLAALFSFILVITNVADTLNHLPISLPSPSSLTEPYFVWSRIVSQAMNHMHIS